MAIRATILNTKMVKKDSRHFLVIPNVYIKLESNGIRTVHTNDSHSDHLESENDEFVRRHALIITNAHTEFESNQIRTVHCSAHI